MGQEIFFFFFCGREGSWLLCGWQPAPWRLFTSFPAHRVDASLPRGLPDPTSSIPHRSVPFQVQVPGRPHAALQEPHCTAGELPALAPREAPVSESSSPWLPNTPHVRPNEHGDLRIEDKHPNEPEESCSRSCRMQGHHGTAGGDTSYMGSSHTIPEQGWCYPRGYYTRRRYPPGNIGLFLLCASFGKNRSKVLFWSFKTVFNLILFILHG